MDETEVGLRELLRLLRRSWWLLLLLPLLLASLAGWVSLRVLEPSYEASTTLWVVQGKHADLDYNTLLLNRDLAKTFVQVMRSRTVAEAAIQSAGLDGVTATDLLKRLRIETVGDTPVIHVVVSDPYPDRAARLANAVVYAFMERLGSNGLVDNLDVVDSATAPELPQTPNLLLNLSVAAFLGLVLALGWVFLREQMDTSLRAPEAVSRNLGLPVLAEIPLFRPVRRKETGVQTP